MNQAAIAFPSLIKQWRSLKKLSQLDLALDAGVSQRHISFLESGRSKPSREMVLNLCTALDVPLRERNQLLNAAGFAPAFKERQLDDNEMSAISQALRITLDHHQPYPAIVVDRNWNMLMTNDSALKLTSLLGDPEQVWNRVDASGQKNVYRLTFHPQGLRPLIENWYEVEKHLTIRLQREINADPNNAFLGKLLEEIRELENGERQAENHYPTELAPIMPMTLTLGGMRLNIFSMISSFGTPTDITAEELKVETFFPADEVTKQFFHQLNQLSS